MESLTKKQIIKAIIVVWALCGVMAFVGGTTLAWAQITDYLKLLIFQK